MKENCITKVQNNKKILPTIDPETFGSKNQLIRISAMESRPPKIS